MLMCGVTRSGGEDVGGTRVLVDKVLFVWSGFDAGVGVGGVGMRGGASSVVGLNHARHAALFGLVTSFENRIPLFRGSSQRNSNKSTINLVTICNISAASDHRGERSSMSEHEQAAI
jgi:hypothetical protein